MIREFTVNDVPNARRVHEANGLPEECFPNLADPLFVHKAIFCVDGRAAMSCFLKGTSELYLLVDHEIGTPEERWKWLVEFKEYMREAAWHLGLDQMTAFVPPEIEESFGKRLLDLGFVKSRFVPYTLNIE